MRTEGHDLPIVLSFYVVLYRGTYNARNKFSVTCTVVFKRQRDAFGDTETSRQIAFVITREMDPSLPIMPSFYTIRTLVFIVGSGRTESTLFSVV